jgi:hypothetical protein
MGWSYGYQQVSDVKRQLEHHEGLFTTSLSGHSYTVLDSAIVGNTYYAAVRRITPEQPAGYVFATVILFRNPKSGFGYKDMCESMGPCEVACPLRILDKLTPVDELPHASHAGEWREAVRQYHRDRAGRTKTAKAFAPGDRVKLAAPIVFRSGYSGDTFTVRSMTRRGRARTVYESPGGSLYTFPQRLLAGAVKLDA